MARRGAFGFAADAIDAEAAVAVLVAGAWEARHAGTELNARICVVTEHSVFSRQEFASTCDGVVKGVVQRSPGHALGLLPMHRPLLHESVWVHALLSSHTMPVNGVQTPLAEAPVAIEQASHGPVAHAVSQQKPSAQNSLSHWRPELHALP